MKFVGSYLNYLVQDRQARTNLRALGKILLILLATVAVFAVAFHYLMIHVEGERHSWITGVYWTLTVMSTLGFGDLTFHSDLGRAFSILVLATGVLLLLVVLPFAFIRFFYAPWLEAQLRDRAPRKVGEGVEGHVVLCAYDSIARAVIRRLEAQGIPYCVIEGDPTTAAHLDADGISVVAGEVDRLETWEQLRLESARCVVANLDDAMNTNISVTVRERWADVPIIAVVEHEDSIDILELAGANEVIALKSSLGQALAARVMAGSAHTNVLGTYHDLVIAEFAVHRTAFSGLAIRETQLRETAGLNIVGYWDHGRLHPARPHDVLSDHAVLVLGGTAAQIDALDSMFSAQGIHENPVVVIGGGTVGVSVLKELKARGVPVHVIEKEPGLEAELASIADAVFIGDANSRSLMASSGLGGAPSVVLTTHDDATNIYLAVYCRKLNPQVKIVCRVSHERNVESIHRAGADFVLSYASLGAKTIVSKVRGHEAIILGEHIELITLDAPPSLSGSSLAESAIGSRTGLNVIALKSDGATMTNPAADAVIEPGMQIVVIGTADQCRKFDACFVGK